MRLSNSNGLEPLASLVITEDFGCHCAQFLAVPFVTLLWRAGRERQEYFGRCIKTSVGGAAFDTGKDPLASNQTKGSFSNGI